MHSKICSMRDSLKLSKFFGFTQYSYLEVTRQPKVLFGEVQRL